MSKNKGIYEIWKLPGDSTGREDYIDATTIKAIGASVFICSSVRHFKIDYITCTANKNKYPWKLYENIVLGTRHPIDNWEAIDEFSSFKEAKQRS